ncbi:MAG: hypothetical protein CME27_06975 [Gemmatimonadetes bacterium]|nr:hypothetical protein [Gemmatimonadota bacterium]
MMLTMVKRASLLHVLVIVACSPPAMHSNGQDLVPPEEPMIESTSEPARTGVLVMAHGAGPEWNGTVMEAVKPSMEILPTAVAFGMANPYTLRSGLDELREQGVTQVAVVRMFLSGESFLDQTEYLLGLSEERPQQFVLMGPAASDPRARIPLEHSMDIATHEQGILDSPYVGGIAVDRAAALGSDPSREAVLLIAHGMGDDGENDRVLALLHRAADQVTREGYADVEVATLREDWEEKRISAEAHIRGYVENQAGTNRVLVIPMRLSGFGPYADVLAGLEYHRGEGLLPHTDIGSWVVDTANEISCSTGWGPIKDTCRP